MRYVLIILLFASCNATKQAAKDEKKTVKLINKAIKISRVTAAKVTRDTFPCTELFKTDTAMYVYDSLIYIDCPNDYHIADSGKMVDTFYKENNKIITIKVPVTLPIRTQIITKFFEDSAKIVVERKLTAAANESLIKVTEKSKRRGTLILWLIVAIVALTATNILTVRTLLTQPKRL